MFFFDEFFRQSFLLLLLCLGLVRSEEEEKRVELTCSCWNSQAAIEEAPM